MSNFNEETTALIKQIVKSSEKNDPALLRRIDGEGLTKDDMNTIADLLSDEFAKNGLGADDEPTDYVMRLERVIDQLTDA